jgi:hypothetical protein
MAQFTLADIPGAFNRGLQFRQDTQLRPLEIAAAQQNVANAEQNFRAGEQNLRTGEQDLRAGEQNIQFNKTRQRALDQDIDIRTEEQKNRAFVMSAVRIRSLPDDQKLEALIQNRQTVIDNKGDPVDSDLGIKAAQAGDFDVLNQGLDNIIASGERQGIIKPRTFESEKIALRQQEAELRASEQVQTRLDRDLARETNELKKEELQSKASENQRKIAQSKRDQNFTANSALSSIDQAIETVDSLLNNGALESTAGFQSIFPTLPGSAASGFESQIDKLKSQTFLLQVEKMKGLGALGEKEGAKLESALAALSIKQPDEKLKSELKSVKQIMNDTKIALKTKFAILSEAETLAKYGITD